MQTNARMALLLALAVALVPACSSDDGAGEDADDAPQDLEGSTCDCAVSSDSASELGVQDLDCFCRENDCLSYEQATAEGRCGTLNTYADCNLIVVAGQAYVGSSFTYDATTHQLIGAYAYSDITSYDCAGEAVFGLEAGVTAFADFPGCELTESTRLCE